METFVQLVVSGAGIGSAYGLIALGFLVVFHVTGQVNFAQGDVLMVGAVATMLALTWAGSYAVALVLVVVAGVAVAFAFQFALLGPLVAHRASPASVIVATIAFGLILQEIAALTVGDRLYGVASILPDEPVQFLGAAILPQTIIMVLVSWALVGLIWLFFTRTLTGSALRAIGVNRSGAAASGARIIPLMGLGIAIAFVTTALAGLLIAPTLGASPRLGFELAVKGFAAAVVGGFDSVYRAMLAGVFIGVTELLVAYYISSAYAPMIAYAVLLVALLLRDTGPAWRRGVRRVGVAT